MIEGLNDSKKHFFVWTIVTLCLFVGLTIGLNLLFSEVVVLPEEQVGNLADCAVAAYVLATLPLGFFARRKILHGYVHVPTEQIKIFETNLVLALYRLIKCEVLAAVNLVLLCFYLAVSFIFGIVLFPYHLISGIVFLIKKTI